MSINNHPVTIGWGGAAEEMCAKNEDAHTFACAPEIFTWSVCCSHHFQCSVGPGAFINNWTVSFHYQ